MRRSLVVLVAVVIVGCAGAAKLDFSSVGSRAAWQHPEEVVLALGIEPGDHVVDLGAGDGYFVPYLAAAVGPTGKVYAVDVDANAILDLTEAVERGRFENVEIVLGGYDNPLVPDHSIDLVLLVNTYHHVEERPAYFRRLQTDLESSGRVAVVDPNEELDGVLRFFLKEEHTTSRTELHDEMAAAGYRPTASFDFLPVQIFEVFVPESGQLAEAAEECPAASEQRNDDPT